MLVLNVFKNVFRANISSLRNLMKWMFVYQVVVKILFGIKIIKEILNVQINSYVLMLIDIVSNNLMKMMSLIIKWIIIVQINVNMICGIMNKIMIKCV